MAADRLKKAITTRKHFRALVPYWAELMGFHHPWTITCLFHDAAKGDPAHETDEKVYCCVQPQPQYHRLLVHADLRHEGWLLEPDINACIRHELFHAFVSLYTQQVSHLVEDKHMEAMFEDLEDELVNRLSLMPVWVYAPAP